MKVGQVINPISRPVLVKRPVHKEVLVRFPSRLNAMTLDSSKIIYNKESNYTPGEIIFKIKKYREISVKLGKQNLECSGAGSRTSLALHSAGLMKEALGFTVGLNIKINEGRDNLCHVGFGSSSGLIAGVACAINEFFGNPIKLDILACYLAENHGEEISGRNDFLVPVQCIGGSAVGGFNDGAIHVISGKSKLIFSTNIDSLKKIVVGLPVNYKNTDSKEQFGKECKNFSGFKACGEKYGPIIAYRLVHEVFPGLVEGNFKPLGNLIFDYRFKMGSIENCSFTYPGLNSLAKKIALLKRDRQIDVLSLSSVGPAFFALTSDAKKSCRFFEKVGMKTWVFEPESGKYQAFYE